MVYKLLFWIDGVDYSSTHFAARFSRPLTEGGKGLFYRHEQGVDMVFVVKTGQGCKISFLKILNCVSPPPC